MKFIHNDLGQRKKVDVVEVTLSSGANVRLLDSHNLSAYRNGRLDARITAPDAQRIAQAAGIGLRDLSHRLVDALDRRPHRRRPSRYRT
jgi:hypothetical protein